MITAFKTEWAASEMVAEATFLLTPKSYGISLIIFVHTNLKFKFKSLLSHNGILNELSAQRRQVYSIPRCDHIGETPITTVHT